MLYKVALKLIPLANLNGKGGITLQNSLKFLAHYFDYIYLNPPKSLYVHIAPLKLDKTSNTIC